MSGIMNLYQSFDYIDRISILLQSLKLNDHRSWTFQIVLCLRVVVHSNFKQIFNQKLLIWLMISVLFLEPLQFSRNLWEHPGQIVCECCDITVTSTFVRAWDICYFRLFRPSGTDQDEGSGVDFAARPRRGLDRSLIFEEENRIRRTFFREDT